jgi:hypothetical protein
MRHQSGAAGSSRRVYEEAVFEKLFRRRQADADQGSIQAIGGDLYSRAKAAADLIGPGPMSVAMSDRGVHLESMLVAHGALAGFACQVAARISPPPEAIRDDSTVRWAEVRGADGQAYFMGDAINHYLLESPTSFWSVAAGIVPQLSAQPLPDPIEIVRHVVTTIGTDGFGSIRFPAGTSAADSPSNYLRRLWPIARQKLDQSGAAAG